MLPCYRNIQLKDNWINIIYLNYTLSSFSAYSKMSIGHQAAYIVPKPPRHLETQRWVQLIKPRTQLGAVQRNGMEKSTRILSAIRWKSDDRFQPRSLRCLAAKLLESTFQEVAQPTLLLMSGSHQYSTSAHLRSELYHEIRRTHFFIPPDNYPNN